MTAVLCSVLTSFLGVLNQEYQVTHRSYYHAQAINLAEAGVEEAMGMLNYGGSNHWGAAGWSGSPALYTKTVTNFTPQGSSEAIGSFTVTVKDATNTHPLVEASGLSYGGYVSASARHVAAKTMRRPIFRWALLAESKIDLNGNNLSVDSFDSSDPNHSDFDSSKGFGTFNPAKIKDNGDAATNAGITNSISAGNANILGHVATGPGGTVSIGPNGYVGSVSNHPNGVIQPDRISHSVNVDLVPIGAPFSGGISLGNVNTTTSIGGGALAPIDYTASSIKLSGTRTLTFASGYSRLFVSGDISVSGNSTIVVADGARVEIYVAGDVSIAGNGLVNHNNVADSFQLYKTGGGSVSVGGNGQMAALIYAPDASVALNGGGASSTVSFIGAIVGETITLNGHVDFHYDEAMRKSGPTRGWMIVSWQED